MSYSRRHKRHYESHAETNKRLEKIGVMNEPGVSIKRRWFIKATAYYSDSKGHWVRCRTKKSHTNVRRFFKRQASKAGRRAVDRWGAYDKRFYDYWRFVDTN